jgi:hypothetical protein
MAERQGFEPWVELPPQRFSRPSHSTTLAPLRNNYYNQTVYINENFQDPSLNHSFCGYFLVELRRARPANGVCDTAHKSH